MTVAVAVLLIIGVLLELGGLLTIAFDVRDTARDARARADEIASLMAANKHIVADWITRATVGNLPRRKWGLVGIALGLVVQTAANLVALYA